MGRRRIGAGRASKRMWSQKQVTEEGEGLKNLFGGRARWAALSDMALPNVFRKRVGRSYDSCWENSPGGRFSCSLVFAMV